MMEMLSLPETGARSRSVTLTDVGHGDFARSVSDNARNGGFQASMRKSRRMNGGVGLSRNHTRYMSRRQRPQVPAISRMQSMAMYGDARPKISRVRSFHHHAGSPGGSAVVPVVFDVIDQQPNNYDGLRHGSRHASISGLANGRARSASISAIGLMTLDQLEAQMYHQYGEEEEEYTKIGQFCLKVTKKLLPCCNDDDESFGHHLSIALVALLSFSTLVFVTMILILVFVL